MIKTLFVLNIPANTIVFSEPEISKLEINELRNTILKNTDPKKLLKEERATFENRNHEFTMQKFDSEIIIGVRTDISGHRKRFLFKIFEAVFEQWILLGQSKLTTYEFSSFVENEINEFNLNKTGSSSRVSLISKEENYSEFSNF